MIWHEPWWSLLLPHLRLERRQADRGMRGEYRLEVSRWIPRGTARALLTARTACAACGRLHYPFRERRGGGAYYLALACPDEVRPACKRSEAARRALDTVIEVIQGQAPSVETPRLL